MKIRIINNTNFSRSVRRFTIILLFTAFTSNLLAQDLMTPAVIWTNSQLREYETSLINYFGIYDADEFACLITPSFIGEYCLSYSKNKNALNLKRATKSIWYEQTRKPIKKVPSQDFSLIISDSLATSLNTMFKSIVLTSSHLQEAHRGFDGTTYQFIIHPYSAKVAECWTPIKDTNCGQAVTVIQELCKAVETNDSQTAENLISEVIRVTNIFKQYYPANFRDDNY